jgi:aminoglycoside phosphotransferase family enzyme/predicted kinase
MPHERLIAAMQEPGFYPQPPRAVEFRQTHISCVFLAGEFVYKIKKPVRFSFVDYSTLELRYHFCREEVRLNRRLTPRVYLGVFPIMRRDEGFALGAHPAQQFEPRAYEYTVKMRRLPDDRSLERLVRTGRIDHADMGRIGLVLAAFHASAAREHSMLYGAPEAIAQTVGVNLEECRGFIGDTITEAEFTAIERFNREFVDTHRGLLDRRARDGMVREGHGDLRSEHICVTAEIDVIDCVEFSQRLRYADIASDLAFLLMDLDRLGAPALGHLLLSTYLTEGADPALPRLLNFYKCFRAVVRGKVSSLKAREREVPDPQRRAAGETARKYFAAAYGYAKAGSPTLIVVCGLPATGKSTVAQALAERSGFEVFNSDVIRKRLAGKAPADRASAAWREGIYAPEFTAATYAALLDAAAGELERGNGVIIDATFNEAAERVRMRELARRMAVPIVFAQCSVSPQQAKARLAARAQEPGAVSDATWEIYLQQQEAFAPFGPEFADCHLEVDGSADGSEAACQIERFVAAHC